MQLKRNYRQGGLGRNNELDTELVDFLRTKQLSALSKRLSTHFWSIVTTSRFDPAMCTVFPAPVSRNVTATKTNESEYDKNLKRPGVVEFTCKARDSAPLSSQDGWVQAAVNATGAPPRVLHIAKGTRVRCSRNIKDKGLYNGMTGSVVSISGLISTNHTVHVLLDSGRSVDFVPEPLQTKSHNGTVVFTRWQVPLLHAWAMSIHKSQGASLDQCTIDLRDVFAPHMGYVAISRCRVLENATIHSYQANHARVDEMFTHDDVCCVYCAESTNKRSN